MPLQTLETPPDADPVVRALEADGAAIVAGLADPGTIDAVAEELAPWIEKSRFGREDFSGTRTQRTGSLITRSRTVRALVANPLVLDVAERILGPHCDRFQLHLTQVIRIGPGETCQPLHRDQWAFSRKLPTTMEYELQTLWALCDFTDENGATRVIAGSHRWEAGRRPSPEETVGAAMSKGSVLLYLGSVYHGGGANRSADARSGLGIGYSLGWLRQEENQYLSVPPEVARELPEKLQRLIGYDMGGYSLGYFGDVEHPREALRRP